MRHLILIITILFYSSVPFAQKTLIHAGSLIDGVTKKMKTKQTIVIEDGVIIDLKKREHHEKIFLSIDYIDLGHWSRRKTILQRN